MNTRKNPLQTIFKGISIAMATAVLVLNMLNALNMTTGISLPASGKFRSHSAL